MPTPEGMRLDEARERIDALERALLAAQAQRDYFKNTLVRISEGEGDKSDTKPDLVRAAKVALMRMELEDE